MKKVLLLAMASLPFTAFAATTITFQGQVVEETCSLVVDGTDTTPIVQLPTVVTSQLAVAGQTVGATQFDIGVTGCSPSLIDMQLTANLNALSISTNGNLENSGTATNVEIQLLDPSSTPINFSSGVHEETLTLPANATDTSATFTAQYYAAGAATAGTVQSTLQYTISYD